MSGAIGIAIPIAPDMVLFAPVLEMIAPGMILIHPDTVLFVPEIEMIAPDMVLIHPVMIKTKNPVSSSRDFLFLLKMEILISPLRNQLQ